jgi:short-subunit dehydrogenase
MTRLRHDFLQKYGPWAVVTGASSGIGRQIAIQLAAARFNLVLLALCQEELEEVASQLSAQHGVETKILAEDLAADTPSDLFRVTESLEVGLLVCAAGFGSCGPFLESDVDEAAEMIRVNCEAVMRQAFHFGRRFSERGRGGIVFLSSVVGFHGAPHFANYAGTKAYVQSLAEALHVELEAYGVDVLAITPGPMKTGFAHRAGMNLDDAMSPEPVARAALQSLGKKSTVIPGVMSKFIAYGLAPAPRWARIRLVGRVFRNRVRGSGSDESP